MDEAARGGHAAQGEMISKIRLGCIDWGTETASGGVKNRKERHMAGKEVGWGKGHGGMREHASKKYASNHARRKAPGGWLARDGGMECMAAARSERRAEERWWWGRDGRRWGAGRRPDASRLTTRFFPTCASRS